MKFRFQILVIGLVMCLFSVFVFALGMDHQGPVKGQDGWPKGLKELANRENRVHGFFVNFDDVFFYSGDTKAFNDFLASYAKLEKTILHLVIHPGPKRARSPWDKEDRDISVDWSLYTSSLDKTDSQAPKTANKFITRIDLFLGGQVGLEGLEVPDNVEVESGGEIEQFVTAHQEKQESQQEQK